MKASTSFRLYILIFLIGVSLVSNTSAPFILKNNANPPKITFLSSFGSFGSGDGQFNGARGVAINNTHIFVTDQANSRIQIFDFNGNFVDKFGSSGSADGQFDNAWGIAVNSSNIFVADRNNNRIQIFDLAGNFVDKLGDLGSGSADGQFNAPAGVAINNTHIFVADTFNDRIQIFDSAGNFVTKFGSSGSADEQFNFPRGITVNNSHIFVADTGNNRIQVLDLAGNFVDNFGNLGSGDGQFNFPTGIVVISNHLYVADSGNDRIQIFDMSDNFALKFGSSGSGDEQFTFPSGMASNGTFLVVADYNNHRIQIFHVHQVTPIVLEDIPKIVILYSNPQELDFVENVITSNFQSVENSSMSFVNFSNTLLANNDMLIILGTNNFTLSTENQTSIQDFANQGNKSIITMTPYIGQFNSSLAGIFGISDFNETYPSVVSPEIWDLEINKTLGTINVGTNVTFQGQFGVFNKSHSSESIAFMAGSSSAIPAIQALNFPLSAIINSSTTSSQIITGSISPISISLGGLHLNQKTSQIPIFEDLVSEIIVASILNHIERNNVIDIPTDTNDTTSSSTLTVQPSETNLFGDNFLWILIIGIVALFVIFRNKILSLLRWFEKKFFGLIIGIIGSVYKIQNRYLDTGQVLVNQTRARILDYLEFIAGYGSHFREIKSVMNVGTGILLWHLQVLEEFGLITQHKIGRYNIFVAYEFNEEFNIEEKRLEIKFRSKYAVLIFDNLIQIDERDKLNITEFSKIASVDRKTIRKHLGILEDEEIVKLEKTSYGVEIVKIDKSKIEKLLKRLQLKETYIERETN